MRQHASARMSAAKVSEITKSYFPKPLSNPPVIRSNDDAIRARQRAVSLLPFYPRQEPAGSSIIGRLSMSKRIALLSAVAFSTLALTATIIAPARAEEKTV